MKNPSLEKWLHSEKQPIIAASATLDGCGRTLLPLDQALLSFQERPEAPPLFSYVTIIADAVVRGFVQVRMNKVTRDMHSQLISAVEGETFRAPRTANIEACKLIRVPTDPILRAQMSASAYKQNLAYLEIFSLLNVAPGDLLK